MRRFLKYLLLFPLIAVLPFSSPVYSLGSSHDSSLNFHPPVPTRVVLANGAVLYLLEDHELPFIDLSLRLPMTPADEENANRGSVGFFGEVWRTGGTKTLPPEKLNETLEKMAARVETNAGEEAANLSVHAFSKDFDRVLSLAIEVLLSPRFDDAELSLAKEKALEGIRRRNDTILTISRRAVRDVLYGKGHYYARQLTEKEVKAIHRSDLVAIHHRVVSPEGAVLSLTGDFDTQKIIHLLNTTLAQAWTPNGRHVKPYDYAGVHAWEGKVFTIDKEANQSRVVIARLGVERHHPDHFALEVANMILGGGGPSRLFGEIRSRQGLAYMVGSFFYENKGPSLLGVVCQTKSESTAQAVQAIKAELVKFSSAPPTSEEMAVAQDSLVNAFVFQFDSIPGIVQQKADLEFYGYPKDYMETYIDHIKKVTPEDVLRVGKTYFNWDSLKVIVVGDSKHFDEELKKLGPALKIPLSNLD